MGKSLIVTNDEHYLNLVISLLCHQKKIKTVLICSTDFNTLKKTPFGSNIEK